MEENRVINTRPFQTNDSILIFFEKVHVYRKKVDIFNGNNLSIVLSEFVERG